MQIAATACLALVGLLAEGTVKRSTEVERATRPTPSPVAPATPTTPAPAPAPAPFGVWVETAAPIADGTSKVKVLDATKIYYGDAKTSKAPSVIDSQRVWDKIPEYQEIKKKGLTEADLEYWVLLKKASKKFNAAVKGAAKAKSKDLVAETGAIEVKGTTIPDITDAVIAALP